MSFNYLLGVIAVMALGAAMLMAASVPRIVNYIGRLFVAYIAFTVTIKYGYFYDKDISSGAYRFHDYYKKNLDDAMHNALDLNTKIMKWFLYIFGVMLVLIGILSIGFRNYNQF